MIIQLTGALAKRGMEYIGLGRLAARIGVFVPSVSVDFKVLTLNPRVLTMTASTRSLTQTLNPRVLTLTVPEE